MKHRKITKLMALILCAALIVGAAPMASYASEGEVIRTETQMGADGYYNIISEKQYTLVPGAATETEMVINNAEGTRRQVLHVIEVDPSNPDVSIVPGYYNIDKDITKVENQKASKLTDMATYYEKQLGYNIVGGMNTDLTYSSDAPRILVYNGQDMRGTASTSSVLCVYKEEDGTVSCEVKAYKKAEIDADLDAGRLLHAVGVSFAMVVNDGELVTKKVERTSSPAARSMVGVKEDGTLVMCMNDGRGVNNSVGLCNYEEGEIMLSLGCKWAANCDGGGSSTFLTKRAGEDKFTMRSVPCDGAERATLHGIFVTSNVAPTGVLETINIESNYDYFAPNTTYTFGAEAIDTHGYAMEMPNDIAWKLSDSSFGTVENGVFVSNGKIGEVDVQTVVGGAVVGSRTIVVANPTTLEFTSDSTVIPYSTEEKVREITLPIVAKEGEAEVYFDTSSFEITLSDINAGTMNGFKFTATSDTTVKGTIVTAKYLATGKTISYEVEFGKGSEIVYDFENGDISDWMAFDEAKQWNIDNNVNNTLTSNNPIGGQFSTEVDGSTFLATKDNGGQVKNGEYALGWNVDNTAANFASWTYNILYHVGAPAVLRDVANGQNATTFGMWVYIPEGAAGLAMQLTVYKGTSRETVTGGTQLHFYFETVSGVKKTLNNSTEADIPESRWVYATVDLTADNYVSLVEPTGNIYREPTFIRTYIKPMQPAVHTFYFDDFTLDYSSAVDDRILPTISEVSYTTNDTLIALENNASISANKISFAATVKDNEALDTTSGVIYVDGNPVDTVIAGAYMSSAEVEVLPGKHEIAFEVRDALGNLSRITRDITITGTPTIEIAGHNDSGKPAEYDSIYYIDLNVDEIENIKEIVTTLKLQTANTWELDHIQVAEGFAAEYTYNDNSKLATVTIKKVAKTPLSGSQTLASLPVRVWSWDAYSHVTGAVILPETQFASTYCPVVSIDCDVVSGNVTFTDNKSATFGGGLSIATNLNDNINPWHYHDKELTVLNQESTCTVPGYENRTYCETCQSVVDWGTEVETSGHSYKRVENQFVCETCDDVCQVGTGLFEMQGKTYYAISNKLVSGWQMEGKEYYYFDKETYEGVNGEYSSYQVASTSQNFTYSFTDGKLDSGVWVSMSDGKRYYYGPTYYHNTTVEIDGNTYSFRSNGYRYEGTCVIKFNPDSPYQLYEFTEDGVYVGELYENGVYMVSDGSIYYLNNGVATVQNGLVKEVDGSYYYFKNSYTAVKDGSFTVTETNGFMPAGVYEFGPDGKMIIKQGVVLDADGEIRYYVDGVATYAGLVKDDEGNYYYISGNGCKAIKDRSYYITFTNGLLPEGTYKFGPDGKMIIKQGVVLDADGQIRYYVNGEAIYAGLVQDKDGNYYYISGNGCVAIRDRSYYITFTNGLLPEGTYKFGSDGKMILKRGVVLDADGEIRYYVNGEAVYAGLVKDTEGNYYYISGNGCVAIKNRSYYITFTNGLLPEGLYKFGADGKMLIKQGVVTDADGQIRYYVDGQSIYAGLVQDKEGNYYYISGNGCVAIRNRSYYVTFTNGLLPEGLYTFGADGKMIQ